MKFMFTTPWGIALTAILAIGTAIYFLTRNMHEMEDNQNALNDETSKWADIIGFTEEKIALNDKAMGNLASLLRLFQRKLPSYLRTSRTPTRRPVKWATDLRHCSTPLYRVR
jgi:hypothetical protein